MTLVLLSPIFLSGLYNQILNHVNFSVKTVASIISDLDSSKATGPDGIPVIVLQKCSPELSPISTKLFKKCLAESCFPSCWKLPSVIPVFKNTGESSNPGNYRPISESILYIYKSTIRPCLEYCCHIWAGAPISSLNILDRVQRRLFNLLGENLYSKLQPLSHRREVASLSLFYRYFHGHCSEDLASLMPRRYSSFNSSIQTHRSGLNNWAVYLPRRNTSTYSNSFIPRTAAIVELYS